MNEQQGKTLSESKEYSDEVQYVARALCAIFKQNPEEYVPILGDFKKEHQWVRYRATAEAIIANRAAFAWVLRLFESTR
jgi:hypothetical protein